MTWHHVEQNNTTLVVLRMTHFPTQVTFKFHDTKIVCVVCHLWNGTHPKHCRHLKGKKKSWWIKPPRFHPSRTIQCVMGKIKKRWVPTSLKGRFNERDPKWSEASTTCRAPMACRNASGLRALTLPSLSPTTLTLPSIYRQERGDLYLDKTQKMQFRKTDWERMQRNLQQERGWG